MDGDNDEEGPERHPNDTRHVVRALGVFFLIFFLCFSILTNVLWDLILKDSTWKVTTMKMGRTGLGRRRQGAGDAADVCDMLCPRYVISVLFFRLF